MGLEFGKKIVIHLLKKTPPLINKTDFQIEILILLALKYALAKQKISSGSTPFFVMSFIIFSLAQTVHVW